jgi:MFS family permease
MTQTAKLDITRADQRGLVIGLNEFSGYLGVGAAGIATGYLASVLGPRAGLLWFGTVVILLAATLVVLAVTETAPWARAGAHRRVADAAGAAPSTAGMFALMSWRDRRMAALCQAGLVEKFVDALVWVFWPVYLHQQDASLPRIGWIVGVYGITWGVAQLFTGRFSDRVGRHRLNVWGMWVCGTGVALLPLGHGAGWWSISAGVTGLGMAMLYPNLSAAVADIAHPDWRASAIGIYRFWRDLGYGIGALGLGAAAALGGRIESAFWFVAIAMGLSGLLLYHWGEETLPRFKPVK